MSYREEGDSFIVIDEAIFATVPGLWNFGLSPDGRILALVRDEPEGRHEIRVVLDWDQEVARATGSRVRVPDPFAPRRRGNGRGPNPPGSPSMRLRISVRSGPHQRRTRIRRPART